MNDCTFDDEMDGLPLPTSKEMIAIGEECLGVSRESARKIAGFDDFRPRMGKEFEGQRRSRIAQQLLRRVENRIRRLDEVQIHPFNGVSYPAWAKQANIRKRRAVMELGWVKGLLENGGCESIEWAENREPNLEAVEVQS